MNIKNLVNNNLKVDRNEVHLEHYINKLDKFIEEEKDPLLLNQVYKIALYFNKKVEFFNPASLYEVEQKLCKHYKTRSDIYEQQR